MKTTEQLFEFINNSPCAFYTVKTVKDRLLKEGYTELFEEDEWTLTEGGKYFVTRNGTSIISFRNNTAARSFMICASHSDSPSFRLKLSVEKGSKYISADVEKYGGMIYYSWLDRPLSVAGRVLVRTNNEIESRLVNIDRDLLVIPSVAIHLNRNVNTGYEFNPARDLLPLVAGANEKGKLLAMIADEAGTTPENIISHDLFLYVRERGTTLGVNGEFILCPRLDDLECVFASLTGYLTAEGNSNIPVLAIFDNEEVGSETKQGAASTFLADTLKRIAGESYLRMLPTSFMVSADNAHALHPNRPDLSDSENPPVLNGGIVVKFNANQRYTTDGVSDAIFSNLCANAGARTQRYYNRADILGGSTLGSISDTKVSVSTVDVGLAQLGMHSAVETAGTQDLDDMILALRALYSSSLTKSADTITLI